MKAMILAAGRGNRLRPLTDHTPKPLIDLHGKTLIEHHIDKLKAIGVNDIVINVAHLPEKIESHLQNGEHLGVNITYSKEPSDALETGGGIVNALPLLGEEPFICLNGDVYCHYPLEQLPQLIQQSAHLVLVPNPAHNLTGDYHLCDQGLLHSQSDNKPYTYAGIAVYHPKLFDGVPEGRFSITPIIQQAASNGAITAELYSGNWHDVGTLERLDAARKKP